MKHINYKGPCTIWGNSRPRDLPSRSFCWGLPIKEVISRLLTPLRSSHHLSHEYFPPQAVLSLCQSKRLNKTGWGHTDWYKPMNTAARCPANLSSQPVAWGGERNNRVSVWKDSDATERERGRRSTENPTPVPTWEDRAIKFRELFFRNEREIQIIE